MILQSRKYEFWRKSSFSLIWLSQKNVNVVKTKEEQKVKKCLKCQNISSSVTFFRTINKLSIFFFAKYKEPLFDYIAAKLMENSVHVYSKKNFENF